MNKSTLILIITGIFILGTSYYFVETNKQTSIERQKMAELKQKEEEFLYQKGKDEQIRKDELEKVNKDKEEEQKKIIALLNKVNGVCSYTSLGTCITGKVSSDNNATACDTSRTWNCEGTGGGINAFCKIVNKECSERKYGSLIWETMEYGPYTFAQATAYCNKIAGGKWRIPASDEMSNTMDVYGMRFTGNRFFWSSTLGNDSAYPDNNHNAYSPSCGWEHCWDSSSTTCSSMYGKLCNGFDSYPLYVRCVKNL